MSKSDDLVPFKRHKAERWTQPSDYLRGADLALFQPQPKKDMPSKARIHRRGLWIPLVALGLAGGLLWGTGALRMEGERTAEPAAAEAPVAGAETRSAGVVFGLCDQGGGTNCVVDGDSFYMGGKSIQLAGIEAPATHSARCDAEALLGWAATERLHAILNSGTVTTSGVEPNRDLNGRLLRTVRVDGREVAQTLTAAGLAKPTNPDGAPISWC